MNMRWFHLSAILLLTLAFCATFTMGTGSSVEFDDNPEILVDITFDSNDNNETTMYPDESVVFQVGIQNLNDSDEPQSYRISTKFRGEMSGVSHSANPTVTGTIDKSDWAEVNVTVSAPGSATPGDYVINILVESVENETMNTTGTVTVTVQQEPDRGVSINDPTASPIEMKEGDSVDIMFTVENTEDATDYYNVEFTVTDETVVNVELPPVQQYITLDGGDTEQITLITDALKAGSATITVTVTSDNDEEATADEEFTINVGAAEKDEEEDKGFLEQDVAGIPLVALFVVIIVVPIVAVVAIGKKKKKAEAPAVPAQPGMTPGMPAQPGMAGQAPGVPQPMVMHCPNCGGVIEIANPAMPQPVQCTHCGSAFQFPGTGQQQPPAQQPPAQPQYGGAQPQQAGYQTTPCPACGTQIPVPPQRPVTVSCPGCAAQYNLN